METVPRSGTFKEMELRFGLWSGISRQLHDSTTVVFAASMSLGIPFNL